MTTRTVFAALAAWAAVLAAAGPAIAECEFRKIGELKVTSAPGPVVEVEIQGKAAKLRLDTSAYATYLTQAGAAALNLGVGENLQSQRVITGQGEVTARVLTLRDLVLGGALRINQLTVLVLPGSTGSDPSIVGSLGLDVLSASDIEIDLPHDRMALYSSKGCEKDSLAYWGENYAQAPTRRPNLERPYIDTTVRLNGRDVTARLQSSSASAVDKATAAAAGVRPDTPGVQAVVAAPGSPTTRWYGPFESFAIGGEEIKNPKLPFADLFGRMVLTDTGSNVRQKLNGLPGMVLGTDFLKSHRVLIANSQGKIYVTYTGGPVFYRPSPELLSPASK